MADPVAWGQPLIGQKITLLILVHINELGFKAQDLIPNELQELSSSPSWKGQK